LKLISGDVPSFNLAVFSVYIFRDFSGANSTGDIISDEQSCDRFLFDQTV